MDKVEKKKVTTHVTIVLDKQKEKEKYAAYTGVRCFSQHNEDYNTDQARSKIYNRVSRGNIYDDERFTIIKCELVRPPLKKKT